VSDRLARIISILFHPVFISPYLLIFFISTDSSLIFQDSHKRWILLLVFCVFTTLLPLLSIYIFYSFRIVRSVELHLREERFLPYLTSAIYYAALFQLLHGLPLPFLYSAVALSGCFTLLVLMLINTKKKISAHAAACGVVSGLLLFSNLFSDNTDRTVVVFVITLFIAGLVGFARLQLKAHTSGEWYGGFTSGFLSVWISIYAYVWIFY
jgi:membrane-associated phospholipid phosphatase